MNARQESKIRSLNLLDTKYHFRENVIKISKHETLNHFMAKCLLSYEILQLGNNFITEAIFKEGGKRADILVLEDEEVWEIVQSETKKSIEKKQKKYPVLIKVFKAEEVIKANIKEFRGDEK